MSNGNHFDDSLKDALLQILKQSPVSPLSYYLVRDDDKSVEQLPRVIVSIPKMEEAIFQSGNYQATAEFTVKSDVDAQTGKQGDEIFAAVMDVLQDRIFKQKLNAVGNVVIQGIVLMPADPIAVEDRIWVRKVTCDFFGFAS